MKNKMKKQSISESFPSLSDLTHQDLVDCYVLLSEDKNERNQILCGYILAEVIGRAISEDKK